MHQHQPTAIHFISLHFIKRGKNKTTEKKTREKKSTFSHILFIEIEKSIENTHSFLHVCMIILIHRSVVCVCRRF